MKAHMLTWVVGRAGSGLRPLRKGCSGFCALSENSDVWCKRHWVVSSAATVSPAALCCGAQPTLLC